MWHGVANRCRFHLALVFGPAMLACCETRNNALISALFHLGGGRLPSALRCLVQLIGASWRAASGRTRSRGHAIGRLSDFRGPLWARWALGVAPIRRRKRWLKV